MTDTTDPGLNPIAAALEHLTGQCRGQFGWITQSEALAWMGPGVPFRITAADAKVAGAEAVARFRRSGDSFAIEATGARPLWVNRQPVEAAVLQHGDMIEFGDDGPLSRIRIYSDRNNPEITISDILSDMNSYLHASRRPWPVRVVRGVGQALRRLLFQTTVLFRVMVLALLSVLTVLLYWQWRTDRDLIADLASGNQQVAALADAVDETRAEALRPVDLDALRTDLSANAERLQSLEARNAAAPGVIAAASGSVAFLQSAYGLRQASTGRMLRHRVGPDGNPLTGPTGKPLFTLDGNGPVAEAQVTGTGFLVAGTGRIVTNRHVALPWLNEDTAGDGDMEPVMVRFLAWFPDMAEPVPVQTLAVSDDADLAVLEPEFLPEGRVGVTIAKTAPAPGETVIVMGYPTGLRSLLAQSGEAFVAQLQQDGETGFWEIAARLAGAGLIAPLSTLGIVGRAGGATLVYDADTTHGGSGGPVLNMAGEVVAVNTAIIPEFGGSNLGVPATHIRALLAKVAAGQ